MLTYRENRQAGFTLVELLIVVIILAILAAIVVPQFASSTKDASDAALRSNLASLRSALDLYRQQHNGAYPGSTTAVPGASCTTGPGTGTAADAANRALAMREQLTLYTNRAGQACAALEPDGSGNPLYGYGPYLRGGALPTNPVTEPSSNAVVATNTGVLTMAGDASGVGWKYDTVSGRIIANTDTADSQGTDYDTY